MVASTGCTPAQAWSDWDLPSLLAQLRYWRRHPPVHLLVAAYLDYKPRGGSGAPATSQAMTDASIEALMAMAPQVPEHLRFKVPGNV